MWTFEKKRAAQCQPRRIVGRRPSTHGVFESSVLEVTQLIHAHGGQVYMDGANMNAQVGLTSPGMIGADVCHLNLHKTFAIPHGGGGQAWVPLAWPSTWFLLPGHDVVPVGADTAIDAISAAPFGSALIPKSHMPTSRCLDSRDAEHWWPF